MMSTHIQVRSSERQRLDKYALLSRRVEIAVEEGDASPVNLGALRVLAREVFEAKSELRAKLESRTGLSVALAVTVTREEAAALSLAESLNAAKYWQRRRDRADQLLRRRNLAAEAVKCDAEVRFYRRVGAPVVGPHKYAQEQSQSHRRQIEILDSLLTERHASASEGTLRRPRSRGAGRPAARHGSHRSSARSGDSGDDSSGSSEPPSPSAGWRLCLECGEPISSIHPNGRAVNSHAKTHDTKCRVNWHRHWHNWGSTREEAEAKRSEYLGRASSELEGPSVAPTALDPYLRWDLGDRSFDDLRQRVANGCRCGSHATPDDAGDCLLCGHAVVHEHRRASPFWRLIWRDQDSRNTRSWVRDSTERGHDRPLAVSA